MKDSIIEVENHNVESVFDKYLRNSKIFMLDC